MKTKGLPNSSLNWYAKTKEHTKMSDSQKNGEIKLPLYGTPATRLASKSKE